MVFMLRSFFIFSSYLTLSLSSVSAVSFIDIMDETNDKAISAKHLPKYIRTIFDSRAEYLRGRIAHLNDKSNAFVSLGKVSKGWQVNYELFFIIS